MPAARPNILLVVIDCARWDKWLGPGRCVHTPNIDRLAAQSVCFDTTLVEKPCTTPSFSSLLSGLYSPRHGVHLVWGYPLPAHVPLLTHTLAELGYTTCAEVTGPLLPDTALDRAFEQFTYRAPCDYLHTAWGDRLIERLRRGHYRSPWLLMLHLWELHEPRQIAGENDAPHAGRDTYEQAVSSLDTQLGRLLDAVGDEAIVILTGDHGEKTAAEQYAADTAVAYTRDALGVTDDDTLEPYHLAHWAGPSVLHQFYGACAEAMRDLPLADARNPRRRGLWARLRDRLILLRLTPWVYLHDLLALGRPLGLTRMLERRGLTDPRRARNKVRLLARGAGREQMLDLHMRMWINAYRHNLREGHMIHVYDFLTRVPLIIRWKDRLPAGAAHQRLIRNVDILPTLLDLLGAAPPQHTIDGASFAPLMLGQRWQPRPAYLSITGLPRELEIRGVRTEDHLYTYGPHNPDLPQELYDLRSDPRQTRNIARLDPQRCAELRALADTLAGETTNPAAVSAELSAADQQRVEDHLRQLGYIE